MRGQDITDLILLAAIWGSSFLFISIAVHDFGPFALMALRTGIGLAILLPLLLWRHALPDLVRHWKPIFIVGIINAAVPFTLLAYAAFVIPAGVLSILNAATPLWGALFAALWIKDILPTWRIAGLVIGFCGMVLLVWDELEIDALIGTGLGLAAGLAAPMSYGLSSTFTNRYLMGVKSIAVATGALMSATLALAPLAFFMWPEGEISQRSWGALLMLAILCTGVTYIIFYRLVMNAGPARASTVTLLIPVFGVLWGWMWLQEEVTGVILIATAIILAGTALATGIVGEKQFKSALKKLRKDLGFKR
ncbi:MAG: DMT family transporter [Burkholderiaceae bacterium]|nr:DMT family transporter [Burkholderiaceae bacterium]MCD8518106.1 DMT family transporter [Burkholderiaceae bacterium]MCD8537347.1 DMT family transporter [Burkholderiaceae bacterium]MCD8565092.1 DMT family transporter [Burkholderiaceae bacterium]